ncbi:MAG: PQQ-dependent dehydrogenase, methanol/ethanol family [Steroidobacteraceae bacterium]
MKRCLLAALLLAACAKSPSGGNGRDWPTAGGDAGKSHHSPLTLITPENAATLGLAWAVDLGTNRVLEATPVEIDGILYTSGVAGRAYAFDAATGKQLWRFEPPLDMQINRSVCCDMANRGVAVARGKVFVSALDGWMYALDAATGQVAWKSDAIVDRNRGYSSTGAPEVAADVVVIGNAGGEYDVRGYVSAFEVETGRLKWRFWIVPRDPKLGIQDHPDLEQAAKTWDPNSVWDVGGGGAPWDAINYDAETGLVFLGTGNGTPYHTNKRSPAGGDQLYLGSIVALDAKTGRLKWFYQQTPGDSWDFESTEPMILTRMMIDGEQRPVIIHAPKNGFLYILDRRDGKLLRANPIVRTNWATAVDLKTGRPQIDREAADYGQSPKIVFPATPGARNWHPASFDPATGLYYASVLDMANLIFTTPGQKPHLAGMLNNDAALIFSPDIEAALPTLPPPLQSAVRALPAFAEIQRKPFVSELRAIDPLTGRTQWAVPMRGWQDRGGVLTTASGLLFQGSIDGTLRVFDERTGTLLKSIDTGTSILAAPMTYEVNDVQYVAVMAAWGGGGYPYVPRYSAAYKRGNQGRLLVFKLGGSAVPIPPELPALEVAPPPPAQQAGVTAATIAQGKALYFASGCAMCHSNQHRSITPDLRRMQPGTHAAFIDIVLRGALVPVGMPRWDDHLSLQQVDAIHAYLIDLQAKTREQELAEQKAGLPLDSPSLAILSNY